ncbi:MAG: di-trans,poly-cis-decaprenylcistransferase [Candidatus Diapherotrites archaeon]|nr:di-trans,poly-cis-decaprenylcistransferase [Candidatus Diapherotrites archaeon]
MELSSVAFIPDGNRRYAVSNGISLAESYALGTQKAWDVVKWLSDYPKIRVGTFYTLSLENLTRKKSELKLLFKIFEKQLDRVEGNSLLEEHQVKLNFVGRTDLLPKIVQDKIAKAEKCTENFSDKTINLAIGYNGRTEIVDAAKAIAQKFARGKISLDQIDEDSFKDYLYRGSFDPDMIIRTSGTQRLSGFLTYQSVYSELYFCDKFWPEFSRTDLDRAIADYDERQRRFGK